VTPHFLAHVLHILESCEDIRSFVECCVSAEELENDRKTWFAVLRALQTLAESAHKLPEDIKRRHSSIPWVDYREFRNSLAHDYLGELPPERVWEFIKDYLPPLETAMFQHIPDWKSLPGKIKPSNL
jgi:uncharacterized protein with HEPN domain